uniref:ENTH domain-containing protein n=1 Tax=Timema bartmani TaxID=61472 RepID=A0A7R9HXH0_9NEOP|nr:unnamed protein product [Timema bartmani]
MQEIAQGTFTYEHFPEVMTMLWKRMLQENKRNWRRTYKALLLLNYLVRNGSERVVTSAREHIYDLRSLENYTYVDEFGKDQGINVRHKVHDLIEFIQDDDKLREERKKAKKNKDKYIGMSNEATGMRFGGGGGGGGGGWEDTPRWKKDEFADWDPDHGHTGSKGRGKGFEDTFNNSDDSEGEGNNKPQRNEYKDREKDSDSVDSGTKAANISNNSTPSRVARPVKKIDLGAAAKYGRNEDSISKPGPPSGGKPSLISDLAGDDDFNPRAADGSEFGDFSTAFNSLGKESTRAAVNDEFADFSSAFSGSNTASVTPPQPVLFAPPRAAASTNLVGVQQLTGANLLGESISGPNILGSQLPSNTNLDALSGLSMPHPVNNGNFSGLAQGSTDLLTDLVGGFAVPTPAPLVTNNAHSSPFEVEPNFNSTTVDYQLITDVSTMKKGPTSVFIIEPASKDHSPITDADTMEEHSTQVPATGMASEDYQLTTDSSTMNKGPTSFSMTELTSKLESLTSQECPQSERLRNLLEVIVRILPGPYTPQKFAGQDLSSPDVSMFLAAHYGPLARFILDKFTSKWMSQGLDVVAKDFLVVEGGGALLFWEAISSLGNILKESKGRSVKIDFVVNVLVSLLKSDEMVSAILEQCSADCTETYWEDTVRMLVSMPNRVANVLRNDLREMFVPETYCKLLCYHIAKCVKFLSGASIFGCKSFVVEPISVLLSKVLVIFNDGRKSPGILNLFKILEDWSSDEACSRVCQHVFHGLSFQAVDPAATMLLQVCKTPHTCYSLLGGVLENSATWKHVLCTKLPLLSCHDWNNPTLLKNLVGFLALEQPSLVKDMLTKLISVWSDRSALAHTSLEQHVYVTQAVLLCTKHVCHALTKVQRQEVEKQLFDGVPVHLESPVEAVRAVGMVTAEMVTNFLHSVMKQEDRPKLCFDYGKTSPKTSKLISVLKDLNVDQDATNLKEEEEKCSTTSILQSNKYSENGHTIYEIIDQEDNSSKICWLSDGDKMLFQLAKESGLHSSAPNVGQTIGRINIHDTKEKILEGAANKIENDALEELDSDDEVDEYKLEEKRPKYLRDLKDGLLETEDYERFSESLKVAEQLIISELSNDDNSLGIELLHILLSLEQKFCINDFENLRFSASVAVVVIYPAHSAEFLTGEFNRARGTYSVNQLLFILDALTEAAKQLSNFGDSHSQVNKELIGKETPVNTVKRLRKDKCEEESLLEKSKAIVRERIESHTRRFRSTPKHTPIGKINHFSPVAGSFLFPLLRGFGRKVDVTHYSDVDCLLTVHVLHTVGTLIMCATNSPISARMGAEVLEVCLSLQHHAEARVRLAVASCVGAVVMSVPRLRLMSDLQELVLEARAWLLKESGPDETHSDCQHLASCVLTILDQMLRQDILPALLG